MFQFFSDNTALQRDEKEREIKGAIVQWRLPVYDVISASGGTYVVATKSTTDLVGTFCYVQPRGDDDQKFLTTLREGDYVTCKGIINGVSMRNIVIKPAIIIR